MADPLFLGIDHLIILVKDLDEAAHNYEVLGFQVKPGGKHAAGTENVLIGFHDGTYIELLAFQTPEGAPASRFFEPLKLGEGFVDYGAWVADADQVLERARPAGARYGEPYTGGRKRDDGFQMQTRMVMTIEDSFGVLPLLFQPITDRTLRFPSGDDAEHANGVTGISEIIIAVHDLAATGKIYRAMLDVPLPDVVSRDDIGANTMTFSMGPHPITLATPTEGGSGAVAEHLDSRGEGPYMAVLTAKSGAEASTLDPAHSHGANLQINPA